MNPREPGGPSIVMSYHSTRTALIKVLFILVFSVISANAEQSQLKVSAELVTPAVCRSRSIKIKLQITIKNNSRSPVRLGINEVLRERYLRKNEKGNFSIIQTSFAPDEFTDEPIVGPSDHGPSSREADKNLSPGASRVFRVVHYLYLSQRDVQMKGKTRGLWVSFEVTNLLKSGTASEFWTDPIFIGIPKNCAISQ